MDTTKCSVCNQPAHASETDDNDRCVPCITAAGEPDPRPGFYYVSVLDGPKSARVRGPFKDDHAAALAAVDKTRRQLNHLEPRSAFYAFGTCRSETDLGPGYLDVVERAETRNLYAGMV